MQDEEQGADGETGAPAWMATFSDLATLLLTFFVLLLSFATMDIQNFQTALGSVKEAFGVQFETRGNFETRSTSIIELSQKESNRRITVVDSEGSVIQSLRRKLKRMGLEDKVSVFKGDRGITLRLDDMVLFGLGSGRLREAAYSVLNAISEIAGEMQGPLSIEGHTDDSPIRSAKFPSNWELSTARAASVVRYLIDRTGMRSDRLQAVGLAHIKPIAPNNSPENRARKIGRAHV